MGLSLVSTMSILARYLEGSGIPSKLFLLLSVAEQGRKLLQCRPHDYHSSPLLQLKLLQEVPVASARSGPREGRNRAGAVKNVRAAA